MWVGDQTVVFSGKITTVLAILCKLRATEILPIIDRRYIVKDVS